jgi:hypothetical protein
MTNEKGELAKNIHAKDAKEAKPKQEFPASQECVGSLESRP